MRPACAAVIAGAAQGLCAAPAPPEAAAPPNAPAGETVNHQARGEFDVTLKPLEPYNTDPAAQMGRMSIDKRFHGALEATSKGEMVSAMTPVKGSAAYVALEQVTGTLDGRHGSFVLQHSATMNRGAPALNIAVVPDSGTQELTGVSGTMDIIITEGRHSYVFHYQLPADR